MKRVVVPELFDSDSGTPRELAGNLADLRMINRTFGGVRMMTRLLQTVAARRKLKDIRWLDVAGSSGDVAKDVQMSLAGSRIADSRINDSPIEGPGITVQPVILDRAPSHMNGSFPSICGDALALPFRDQSFDVVSSTLFAHHLEPDELVKFINEALRVARYAVLINDLVRHPVHYALTIAGRAIYRSRVTRHDAPVSVHRSYTVDEMRGIVAQSSAANIEVTTSFLFRMGVIAWKQA